MTRNRDMIGDRRRNEKALSLLRYPVDLESAVIALIIITIIPKELITPFSNGFVVRSCASPAAPTKWGWKFTAFLLHAA